jgi:DNA-binding NarL/FixJ family response regulator
MKKPYTIILADDHAMMRDGIRNLIDAVDGLEVIAEAGDGLELLKIIKKTVPDMVILDISMPGLRGIEAAREILALHPQVNILILSMHKREEFLAMALAAGVKGYLLKEDTGEELLQAIERVRRGAPTCPPGWSKPSPPTSSPSAAAPTARTRTRLPTGSARSCSSLQRVTRTGKSVKSSTSACARCTITTPTSSPS